MPTQKISVTIETQVELSEQFIGEQKLDLIRFVQAKLALVGEPIPDTLPEGVVKWTQS
jgi:hypothetical protein